MSKGTWRHTGEDNILKPKYYLKLNYIVLDQHTAMLLL